MAICSLGKTPAEPASCRSRSWAVGRAPSGGLRFGGVPLRAPGRMMDQLVVEVLEGRGTERASGPSPRAVVRQAVGCAEGGSLRDVRRMRGGGGGRRARAV